MRNIFILVALGLVLGIALIVTSFRQADSPQDTTTPVQTETNNTNNTNDTTSEASSDLRTDRVENDYFVFERIVPAEVMPGVEYTITLRFEAKENLQVLAYSEEENVNTALVSGQLRNISTGMEPGDIFEVEYVIRIETTNPSLTLTGSARVPTGGDDGGGLTLDSEISVVE